MFFPHLEMAHLVSLLSWWMITLVVLWTVSFLAHFLWQWQARGHHSSPQNSVLWGVDRDETRPPFHLTYIALWSRSWTPLLPVLPNSYPSSQEKRLSFYNVVQFLLELHRVKPCLQLASFLDLTLNLSFLPWQHWRGRKGSYTTTALAVAKYLQRSVFSKPLHCTKDIFCFALFFNLAYTWPYQNVHSPLYVFYKKQDYFIAFI